MVLVLFRVFPRAMLALTVIGLVGSGLFIAALFGAFYSDTPLTKPRTSTHAELAQQWWCTNEHNAPFLKPQDIPITAATTEWSQVPPYPKCWWNDLPSAVPPPEELAQIQRQSPSGVLVPGIDPTYHPAPSHMP
jgi:hypothetical protein